MRLLVDIILYCASGWLLIMLVTALVGAPDERRASRFEATSSTAEMKKPQKVQFVKLLGYEQSKP